MLTYILAVLSACANAAASVLQRQANQQVPQTENLTWTLIWRLLHKPVWFSGVLAVIAGFLLQATALGAGQLAVVQPILVLDLPLTLILASRVFGSRMRWREWASAIAMTTGLAGLLYFLSPSAGQPASMPFYGWLAGIGANLALVGVLIAWGRHGPAGRGGSTRGSSSRQAAVLGVAAGVTFGLTAALMKGMTATFSSGIGALFTSWQLYGMIAAGILGMFLLQSALNAGRLIAVQPGLTLSDPIVSILWGVLAFHEKVQGGTHVMLAAFSGLLMAGAVVALARSPLLSEEEPSRARAQPENGQRRAADRQPSGMPQAERR
jgi:drug/metabolite transporter (DMT)-like permease